MATTDRRWNGSLETRRRGQRRTPLKPRGNLLLRYVSARQRYQEEPGTGDVDDILDDGENEIPVSSLSIVETVAAFRRKRNREEVTRDEMRQSSTVFFQEALDRFIIIPVEEALLAFTF